MTRANGRDLPRFTLTRHEAATALGVSLDTFEQHIQPQLRVVRVGRLVLIPTAQLSAWVDRNAALTMEPLS